jgi:dipeptidase E
MKKLYLGSSISNSAKAISGDIGKKGLKLLCITTAAEPDGRSATWMEEHYEALKGAEFEAAEYTLTDKNSTEVERKLSQYDAIFVAGGNTFYLLDKIRKSGADKIIPKLIESGKIYIGSSAGSIVAGPDIYPARDLNDSGVAPDLKDYRGLNMVNFVILPHWGSEIFKESYKKTFMEQNYNENNKIMLIGDYQYIKVEGETYKIVDIPH